MDAIATVRVTGRRRPTAAGDPPERLVLDRVPAAKDGATGDYLIGDPRASVDQLNPLWGLQVVVVRGA